MKMKHHLSHNILCMIVISLIANMSGSMILPLFAIYVEQYGITAFSMSVLFSLFYVGRFLGGGITGKLYNKIGAKRIGIGLLCAEFLCMVTFPLATSFWVLAILRLIQGLVAIGLSVFVRITINNLSTNENRGILNGYMSSSEGAGMILGPVMSGIIVLYFSLSVPFYVVAFLAFISLIAVSKMVFQKDSTHLQSEGTEGEEPLKKLTGQLFLYSSVHFIEISAYAIFLTYFSVYAKYKLGWDTFDISLAFAIVGIATFLSAPFIGKLSDILKDRLLLCIIGLFLIMVEIIFFLFFNEKWVVYLGMLIGGVGGASYLDSFFSHIGDVTPERQRSVFMGNLASLSELGAIISPLIAGILIEKINITAPFYYNIILVIIAMFIQAIVRSKLKNKRIND
ncbi:MFS transporter [Paenibacillus albidus]|uniref:MFS transporter n=1 Tax=Paenibacillus albidus TaxID=2041023 RepID=UPI001BE68DD5|nr:MFS transporter [Paenibacillus albidus]MBT2289456.1 MFS transporter [Paenibacillus albidus]